jgi:hypothetical protein
MRREMARHIFLGRYYIARCLLYAAMKVMPPCRYRTELNAALWGLAFRVQAVCAAHK